MASVVKCEYCGLRRAEHTVTSSKYVYVCSGCDNATSLVYYSDRCQVNTGKCRDDMVGTHRKYVEMHSCQECLDFEMSCNTVVWFDNFVV